MTVAYRTQDNEEICPKLVLAATASSAASVMTGANEDSNVEIKVEENSPSVWARTMDTVKSADPFVTVCAAAGVCTAVALVIYCCRKPKTSGNNETQVDESFITKLLTGDVKSILTVVVGAIAVALTGGLGWLGWNYYFAKTPRQEMRELEKERMAAYIKDAVEDKTDNSPKLAAILALVNAARKEIFEKKNPATDAKGSPVPNAKTWDDKMNTTKDTITKFFEQTILVFQKEQDKKEVDAMHNAVKTAKGDAVADAKKKITEDEKKWQDDVDNAKKAIQDIKDADKDADADTKKKNLEEHKLTKGKERFDAIVEEWKKAELNKIKPTA